MGRPICRRGFASGPCNAHEFPRILAEKERCFVLYRLTALLSQSDEIAFVGGNRWVENNDLISVDVSWTMATEHQLNRPLDQGQHPSEFIGSLPSVTVTIAPCLSNQFVVASPPPRSPNPKTRTRLPDNCDSGNPPRSSSSEADILRGFSIAVERPQVPAGAGTRLQLNCAAP